jgi:gluconokinase
VHIWIFFGQSGSGKSFVGRICADEFNFELYDGDRDLTPEMLRALYEHRIFTDEMRTGFTAVLSRGISAKLVEIAHTHRSTSGLAVCQGLFKLRDRDRLQLDFPNARLIWVSASDALIEERLRRRAGHVASSDYARLVNGGFEPPAPPRDILENDGDRARVVHQLRAYLG